MKRDLFNILLEWKKAEKRKPILLRGARQTGKTWLVRRLGEEFENIVECNFEQNTDFIKFFGSNLDPEKIVFNISNYTGKNITPGKTLLFLDEIQHCPRAVLALRYFYEQMPDLHVIGSGSLLEFELRNISVPVGRIQFYYLYPMSFLEYLCAKGKQNLRDLIVNENLENIAEPIHNQLMSDIRDYFIIGGMPEAVKNFIETSDIKSTMQILSTIIETYRNDFGKYAKNSQIKYLRMLFDSIPYQLGSKFKYSKVSQDIKSRDLAPCLELLEMAGLVYRVYHSSANGIPLGAQVDLKKFKTLFFDIGIVNRIMNLDYTQLLVDPDISLVHKGMLAELFAGQELIAYSDNSQKPQLYYWHREEASSNAEVDYVIANKDKIVPVEVKAESGGRMYSMHRFMEEKKAEVGIRVAKYEYSRHGKIVTLPFYGIIKTTDEN